MGQRSQMYIKTTIIDKDGNENTKITGKHFQWCYDERMLSRAVRIMEWAKENAPYINWGETQKKLGRIMEVNQDMNDVVLTTDIVKEMMYKDDYELPTSENVQDFNNNLFFKQDNNNGQFFLEVIYDERVFNGRIATEEEQEKATTVRYAFTPWQEDDKDTIRPWNAGEYLTWNMYHEYDDLSQLEFSEDSPLYKDTESIRRAYQDFKDGNMDFETLLLDAVRKTHGFDIDDIQLILKNIHDIEKTGTLMTPEQLRDFITYDYSKCYQEARRECLTDEIKNLSMSILLDEMGINGLEIPGVEDLKWKVEYYNRHLESVREAPNGKTTIDKVDSPKDLLKHFVDLYEQTDDKEKEMDDLEEDEIER